MNVEVKFHALHLVCFLQLCSLVAGCKSSPVEEHDLSGLLFIPSEQKVSIDGNQLRSDSREFQKALSLPHATVFKTLGAHEMKASAWMEISEIDDEENTIKELTTTTILRVDKEGNFHGIQNNTDNYGREIIFRDGHLYIRARYGRFHRRKPNSANEVQNILNDFFHELSANTEVFNRQLELSAANEEYTPLNRPAQRITFSQTAKRRKGAMQKSGINTKWRATIKVRDVSGEVYIDQENHFPLAGKVTGSIRYIEDDISYAMNIRVDQELLPFDEKTAILAPPDGALVSLERHREKKERSILLKGIAPPERSPGRN